MTDIKIGLLLTGVPQLQRALELANPKTREASKLVIRRGTQAVLADAKRRIHSVSGELAASGRDEYSEDGLIGYVRFGYGKLPRRSRASTAERQSLLARRRKRSSTKTGKGAYAPVVERGDPRRHHRPHPFVIPALADHRAEIIDGLGTATKQGLEGSV